MLKDTDFDLLFKALENKARRKASLDRLKNDLQKKIDAQEDHKEPLVAKDIKDDGNSSD